MGSVGKNGQGQTLAKTAKVGQELGHRGIAVVAFAGHGVHDDGFEVFGNLPIRTSFGRWFGIFHQNLGDDGQIAGRAVGNAAGQAFIQDDSQTINVGAGVQGIAADLFGTHIERSAQHCTGSGEASFVGGAHDFCDPKIEEFHKICPLARTQENVFGLDVAMQNTTFVGGSEGLSKLFADVDGVGFTEGRTAREPLSEAFSEKKLHFNIRATVAGDAHVEDFDDVGRRNGCGEASLAVQAGDQIGGGRKLGIEDFDGDGAVQEQVLGNIHGAHASLADAALNAQLAAKHFTNEWVVFFVGRSG